jgi:hypothetical protein
VRAHGCKFDTRDARTGGQEASGIRPDVHFWKGGWGRFVGGAGNCSGSSRDEGGGCGCAGDTDDVIEAWEADGVYDFAIEEVEQHGFELHVLGMCVEELGGEMH